MTEAPIVVENREELIFLLTDLASAQAAIETIVEQGEGARSDREDAHFGMFLRVLVEYLEFKRRPPDGIMCMV